jgi:hypothetical protein
MDEREKSQIKQLVQSYQWPVIERFAEELKKKIREDDCSRDTQWETLKTLLLKEGQVRGITRLIQELYKCHEEKSSFNSPNFSSEQ